MPDNSYPTEDLVFAELLRRGADRAAIKFSGGNDEGGADSITLLKGDDEIATLDEYHPTRWDAEKKRYVSDTTPEQEKDAALARALMGPIYARYFTFAGDFYVHGDLTWDAVARETSGDSNESYSSSESHSW